MLLFGTEMWMMVTRMIMMLEGVYRAFLRVDLWEGG